MSGKKQTFERQKSGHLSEMKNKMTILMEYYALLLFLKLQQNLKLSSAANCR